MERGNGTFGRLSIGKKQSKWKPTAEQFEAQAQIQISMTHGARRHRATPPVLSFARSLAGWPAARHSSKAGRQRILHGPAAHSRSPGGVGNAGSMGFAAAQAHLRSVIPIPAGPAGPAGRGCGASWPGAVVGAGCAQTIPSKQLGDRGAWSGSCGERLLASSTMPSSKSSPNPAPA